MKISLTTLFFIGILTSCTSEYEERFQKARELQSQLEKVKETHQIIGDDNLIPEIKSLEAEINFLAKVSGNEDLFLKELDKL